MARLRIGISGWTYPRWRGAFYPKGLAQKNELAFASRLFNSIEVNGSFYCLQSPATYRAWYDQAPPGFLFSVKGSRFITHMKKLNEPRQALANFFASGPLVLREKLGPILWQFPPMLGFDEKRFTEFFELLPKTVGQAARLASEHDDRVEADPAFVPKARSTPLRYAVEVRHESFLNEDFIDLLRSHNIALVIADTAGKWVFTEDLTADFVYVRLHGEGEIYAGGYDDVSLRWWADRVRSWSRGRVPKDAALVSRASRETVPREIFVYFDNDAKVRAPFDALALAGLLGLEPDFEKEEKNHENQNDRHRRRAQRRISLR